jgi:hypothetical protein
LSESPGANCLLQVGYKILRHATEEEQHVLPVWRTWGYFVMRRLAEELARTSPNSRLERRAP